MRRRRTEPHLNLIDEDSQLKDAERWYQTAQKPVGLLRAAQRPAGIYQGEIRGDPSDAAVRRSNGSLQRDRRVDPAGPRGRGHGQRRSREGDLL